MKTATYLRLSLMMFLQFAVWGVWYVTLGDYLTSIGFQGTDVGKAYSTLAWASILSAFFVSMIADRYFSAEKLTGILHLASGITMYMVSQLKEPGLFFWVLLLYMIFYMPTIALTSAIAFRHSPEAGKQFPLIRVLGTIGWIVAGIAISLLKIEKTQVPMQIASVLSVILGIYSFTLPKTPPKATGEKIRVKDVLGLDALKLMKNRSFAILILATLLISLPFAMYHQFANMSMNDAGLENVAGKMTLGQMSEVIFHADDAVTFYPSGHQADDADGNVRLVSSLPSFCFRKQRRTGFLFLYRCNSSRGVLRLLLCFGPDMGRQKSATASQGKPAGISDPDYLWPGMAHRHQPERLAATKVSDRGRSQHNRASLVEYHDVPLAYCPGGGSCLPVFV